eukprot:TRINITY_DN10707_c0_g1_i1.p1 TRINITY_DN10707_c0_g1~~TRINITY_DN10707_c0_g1_i1.p1  ORF type:complete len:473 (-),score=84.88 TRINITY_DN10707_c0_g1_i1:11-1429(-)
MRKYRRTVLFIMVLATIAMCQNFLVPDAKQGFKIKASMLGMDQTRMIGWALKDESWNLFGAVRLDGTNYFFYEDMAWTKQTINGVTYESCIDSGNVPPLRTLLQETEKAYPLSDYEVAHQHVTCAGNMWHVEFVGEKYVVCKEENNYSIYSDLYVIKLEHDQGITDSPPQIAPKDCRPSTYTYVKDDVSDSHNWYSKRSLQQPGNETCILVHGSGINPSDFKTKHEFIESYWGKDIYTYLKQCKDVFFYYEDSFYTTWYNNNNSLSFCNIATSDQEDSYLIRNKIIISHSMGNLVIANAIMNGYCAIDHSTTRWYEIMAPLEGSKVANYLEKICSKIDFLPKILQLEMCDDGKPTPAYLSLLPGTPGLEEASITVRTNTTGAMCGRNAKGLISIYSTALELVASISDLETPNDGLVALHSCIDSEQRKEKFSEDSNSLYYSAAINHADGTCRNGDGWWGKDRKPCSWYASRY